MKEFLIIVSTWLFYLATFETRTALAIAPFIAVIYGFYYKNKFKFADTIITGLIIFIYMIQHAVAPNWLYQCAVLALFRVIIHGMNVSLLQFTRKETFFSLTVITGFSLSFILPLAYFRAPYQDKLTFYLVALMFVINYVERMYQERRAK